MAGSAPPPHDDTEHESTFCNCGLIEEHQYHCVAVPIFDGHRQPVGAVTVMAPINRMLEEGFSRFAQRCHGAIDRIEWKLKG